MNAPALTVSPEASFARLRLSSPDTIRPYAQERPKPLMHRRAYSLDYTSAIRLPLPQRAEPPRTLPPMRVTPPRAASPPPRLAKRTIFVNPLLAKHLQRGGMVSVLGTDGRRMRVFLPPRLAAM